MKRLRALVVAVFLAVGLSSLGCATMSPYGGAVGMRVESNLPDATVWVDDVLVGNVRDWARDGKHIRSGFHRIEVRHSGYYSFFKEVELPDGAQAIVNAQLRPTVE
jgi:hypothetical protein